MIGYRNSSGGEMVSTSGHFGGNTELKTDELLENRGGDKDLSDRAPTRILCGFSADSEINPHHI